MGHHSKEHAADCLRLLKKLLGAEHYYAFKDLLKEFKLMLHRLDHMQKVIILWLLVFIPMLKGLVPTLPLKVLTQKVDTPQPQHKVLTLKVSLLLLLELLHTQKVQDQ